MTRIRLARLVPLALAITALIIYFPALGAFSRENGFWFLLPVWVCLLAGYINISLWVEERIGASQSVSPEVHNSNFFQPSIWASGWSDRLRTTGETIDEAFRTTRGRVDGVIGVVDEKGSELVLRWQKQGWKIELTPKGERVQKVAVNEKSRWAGKEIKIANWFGVFQRLPTDLQNEKDARDIVSAFLGLRENPSKVDWATIRYA